MIKSLSLKVICFQSISETKVMGIIALISGACGVLAFEKT